MNSQNDMNPLIVVFWCVLLFFSYYFVFLFNFTFSEIVCGIGVECLVCRQVFSLFIISSPEFSVTDTKPTIKLKESRSENFDIISQKSTNQL